MLRLLVPALACLCVAFAGPARAAEPMPYVQGDQKTFNEGVAAFDAGDYPRAYAVFSKLADHEDLAAMRNVAFMERKGLGTKKDPGAAQHLYEYVARAGLPTAQADLAEMLLDGEAGPPDPKAALPWLYLASAASHPIAQYRLGLLYEQGTVVPRDLKRAKYLYAAAAAHGEKRALARLSYLNGWPVPGTAEPTVEEGMPQAANP